jgi:hypothetical protein
MFKIFANMTKVSDVAPGPLVLWTKKKKIGFVWQMVEW